VISRVSDGVILEANDSFVSLSGYSKEELIGKSTIELGLYADPAIRDRALTMMKERNFVHDYEFPMKRKSGEIRQVSFSAEPLELHGTHCWLTLGRDITERKQVEHEREQLLIQEKSAREEAESANRLKDEFLATISHELRTPLTSILGWATMLSSNSLSESQVHHALDVITQSAKSQGRLIDDILDTSRIITGRLRLDSRLVEIDQVFQDAIDVVRPTAEAKKIQLHVVIKDERSMVFGDVNRLQQAIWNLLSNAVKFTNPGGRIDAWLTRKENLIDISISDTGVGIDPEFLPHVFERFRQADSTSTRRFGGLGLGLAIVRYIVEMHGGTVSAFSRGKGQGSTFIIQFPISSIEMPTLETPAPAAEASELVRSKSTDHYQRLDGLRVLIVDDDRDTLEMLQFILQGQGATVMTASSTAEAMRSLDTCPPDVLVSDIAMPEQDGYALIAQVRSRSRETGGEVPAIALTAYARSEDRVRALTAGFQTYVVKPVEPGEFVAVIASLMKRS
jgi:PAS domain S-box-containing protein